jgi:TolB protein
MAKKCPNCNEMSDSHDICSNCGISLPSEETVKKKKPKAEITGILSVSPKSIELLELRRSEVRETYLLLTRTDFESEKFSGTIKTPDIPGFKIKSENFEGLRNVINVLVEAKQLEIGQNYEGFIEITSTIGEAKIPIQLGISGDSPQLGLDTNQLQINMNKREKSAIFNVVNVGCGTLIGSIKSKTSWLTIDESSFSLGKDSSAEVEVSIDKREMAKIERGGRISLEGAVSLETNAGDEEIKVVIYLNPRKTWEDYKSYIPVAAVTLLILIIFVAGYPFFKKILTPKEIRPTGLWGELMGPSGSKKMTEIKWNPFSEPEKLVFTAIKEKDGQVCEIKLDTLELSIISPTSKNRIYTPACSPDGYLFALGIAPPGAVTADGKDKCVNLAIANEQKAKSDIITDFTPKNNVMKIACDPSWSPDGKKIVYVKTASPIALHGDVMIVEYNNAESYIISDTKEKNIHIQGKSPIWSTDSSKVLLEDLNKEIYIIEPQGRNKEAIITRLTDSKNFNAFSPKWSPDDKLIVFTRDLGKDNKDTSDIYIMNVDGKDVKSVTVRPDYEDSNPDFSPDGKLIAFDSTKYGEENSDIYIVGIDGKDLKNITNTKEKSERCPVWSPDGKKIAYLGKNAIGWQIYVVNMEDKKLIPRELTNDDYEHSIPIWWVPQYYDRFQKLSGEKK